MTNKMKRYYLLLLIYVLLFVLIGGVISTRAQVIRVANNNSNAPTGDNIFATAQEAIDAANTGDIVQIAPSETNYGDITIDKSITLFGIGYNPDKDSPFLSRVDDIDVTGSAASGTSIIGVRANQISLSVDTGSPYTQSNITIKSSRVNRIHQNTSNQLNDLQIINCWISAGTGTQTIVLATDDKISNALIANNIIDGYSGGAFGWGAVNAGNFTIIRNNLFVGPNNVNYSFAFHKIEDCIISNNVFYGRSPRHGTSGTSENNIFSNNLSYGQNPALPPPSTGTGDNTGSGNLENTDPKFVGVVLGGGWQLSYDPTYEGDSPAIGAGTDDNDLGILGGDQPFTNYTTGSVLPVIQELDISGLVNQGENLEITITAKSTN